MYKGSSSFDTGIVYAPYMPLQWQPDDCIQAATDWVVHDDDVSELMANILAQEIQKEVDAEILEQLEEAKNAINQLVCTDVQKPTHSL